MQHMKYFSSGESSNKIKKIENEIEEDNTEESVLQPVARKSIIQMDEEDTAVERSVKRKMVSQNTMYQQMLAESAPDDEEAVLEYYVRKAQEHTDLVDDAEYYDVVEADKRLFFKMVDMWIQDAGETRRGHREFVQVALNNLDRFNVQHESKAYLKILECYPQSEHTGMRRDEWFKSVWQDKIIDHELGGRLFSIMAKNNALINDEFYNACMRLFGKFSRATVSARQLIFWQPRLSAFVPFLISKLELEKLTPIEIAVRGLRQVNPGIDASYRRFEVDSSVLNDEKLTPEAEIDCIISVQTDHQREMLDHHDVTKPLFVEGPNMVYFQNKKIQYYIMRTDPIENKIEMSEQERVLTDKEWWTQFYGSDFGTSKRFFNKSTQELYSTESFLPRVKLESKSFVDLQQNEIIQVEDDTKPFEGNVFAVAATDHKSIGALRSWVKGLEPSNPKLSQLTVIFNEKVNFLSEGYKIGPQNIKDDHRG
uniref:evolutionarily conserved signaling intermediate in Toll pathway, mitochondrial-like n=1 Tax=Styela clava TaxID=7725 RepID=UPI001939C559|nr:evolutionarily conserved signaling intermediate in Toll pathway, mitochondrial-like [Styela clava]